MKYESLVSNFEIVNLERLQEIVYIDLETLDLITNNSNEIINDISVAYFKGDISIEENLDLETLFDELVALGKERNYDFKGTTLFGNQFL